MGVSWATQTLEMSPGTRHRTEPSRNGQGSGCRWGTGRRWQAPGAAARRPERGPGSAQERRGQPDGSPREAPQERTRGLQARPAVQVGAPRRGRTPPGKTQLPASPLRGTELPVALPDRASGALVGLVRSEEAPGPDRARRRRVGRGRGGGKGRRQTPPPPRLVPSTARRPGQLLRPPAPPRPDGGHRAALRPRGWRQGGAGRRPEGTGVRVGGGKGPHGARVRKRGPSAVPAKSGPLPVLGCYSDWTPAHLPACCPLPPFPGDLECLLPGLGHLTHHSLGPRRNGPGRLQSSPARRLLPKSPLLRTGRLGSRSSLRDTQLCDPWITMCVLRWGLRHPEVKGQPGGARMARIAGASGSLGGEEGLRDWQTVTL